MTKLSLFARLIPKLKDLKMWLFADGKFQLDRAVIILLGFIILLVAIHVFGFAQVEVAIELLDELSDIIGYSS